MADTALTNSMHTNSNANNVRRDDIAKQELALKERVDALKNTEAKLNGNIVKHKRTLRDVGVREAEMKILDM